MSASDPEAVPESSLEAVVASSPALVPTPESAAGASVVAGPFFEQLVPAIVKALASRVAMVRARMGR